MCHEMPQYPARMSNTNTQQSAAPELLTTAEAAALLRVHPQTLASMRVEGRGPKYIGGGDLRRVLYRRVEIERWLSANERTSTSE